MKLGGAKREARVSIRLMWPFVRLAGSDADEMKILDREGIGLAEFANPDTRLRHAVVMELLVSVVRRTGDPTIGLRAAEHTESGELDVLEYASRSCANLGAAIQCTMRYMHLLNEAVETSLEESGDLAIWRFWASDGLAPHPAANDFLVAGTLVQGRRFTGTDAHLVEMHLTHERPSYAAQYARIFPGQVRFGMPRNAIVMRRSALLLPTLAADRGIHAAFELQARALSARLCRDVGVGARVREVALAQIPKGDASMEFVARKLAMSVATLRRRLEHEGTSHREILDELRRDLAERYLGDSQLAISEVAFLLGFSHVTALHKAFKRWTGGTTPAEYRAQQWQQASGQPPKGHTPSSALGRSS